MLKQDVELEDISDNQKDYCWWLGEQAFLEGESKKNNPFKKSKMHFWWWLRAFESKEEEKKNAKTS